MITVIKSLVITASTIGLVGCALGATQAPGHRELSASAPAPSASLQRGWQVRSAAASSHMGAATAKTHTARPRGDAPCLPITGDGVRIRSTADPSGAILGLAYRGDMFRTWLFVSDRWMNGTDTRTGVNGWVELQFLGPNYTYC